MIYDDVDICAFARSFHSHMLRICADLPSNVSICNREPGTGLDINVDIYTNNVYILYRFGFRY